MDKASSLDKKDSLKEFQSHFYLPSSIYFCGNSLGLQPKQAEPETLQFFKQWKENAVEQWFAQKEPWVETFNSLRAPLARIVGALETEVAIMHTLTVNFHLLLASFYKPTPKRFKILVDGPVFPSDLHALLSQIKFHGYDPKEALIILEPDPVTGYLSKEKMEVAYQKHGASLALTWFSGVNYLTGQYYDLPFLSKLCKRYGSLLGLDLAHAVGNVLLQLHNWDIDFAVWCHYKYLNAGPGSVGGAFVHKRHFESQKRARLAGWWGMPLKERFEMSHSFEYHAESGANGWQLSTPPILLAGALKASLDIFEKAGMETLREKSIQLTCFLEEQLAQIDFVQLLTPKNPQERGAQLSIKVKNGEKCLQQLKDRGIICDLRAGGVLRIAPVPLYNRFVEIEQFVKAFALTCI